MNKSVKNAALVGVSIFILSSVLSIVRGVDFFTFAQATVLSSALAFVCVIFYDFCLNYLNRRR